MECNVSAVAPPAAPAGLAASHRLTRVRQIRGLDQVDLTDVVASIRVRYSSLDVDHADPAKSSTADGWGCGPDRLRSTGHNAHFHLHAQMVRRKSDKGAVKRDRMARIGRNRNRDKANVANGAACRIEINPTGAWQIDLRPGMSSTRRAEPLLGSCGSLTGSARYPDENRAARPTSAPRRSSA